MNAAVAVTRLPVFTQAKLVLFRAVVLPRLLYGAEVALFSQNQIAKIRVMTLNTLRPSLTGKRRHRDLALALLYYDTPVDLGAV